MILNQNLSHSLNQDCNNQAQVIIHTSLNLRLIEHLPGNQKEKWMKLKWKIFQKKRSRSTQNLQSKKRIKKKLRKIVMSLVSAATNLRSPMSFVVYAVKSQIMFSNQDILTENKESLSVCFTINTRSKKTPSLKKWRSQRCLLIKTLPT